MPREKHQNQSHKSNRGQDRNQDRGQERNERNSERGQERAERNAERNQERATERTPDFVEDDYAPATGNKLNLTELKQKSMIAARSIEELQDTISGSCVTIGNFDGVHAGHQRLIARTCAKARAENLVSVIVTFDPHPLTVLLGKKVPPFLCTVRQRLELIERLGPNVTLVLEFTRAMAQKINEDTENIGARRLYTLMEKILADLSFEASDMGGKTVQVDSAYVRDKLADIAEDRDLSRYIL